MIFGMTPLLFIHVAISLLGIASGFVVLFGLINNKRLDGWTWFFLTMTIFTSVSGVVLPAANFTPAHAFAILSLIVLAVALYARYSQKMKGIWRVVYIGTAMFAQYLNVFVLVLQFFQKILTPNDLAPKGIEATTQLLTLIAFTALSVLAVKRFHTDTSNPVEPASERSQVPPERTPAEP